MSTIREFTHSELIHIIEGGINPDANSIQAKSYTGNITWKELTPDSLSSKIVFKIVEDQDVDLQGVFADISPVDEIYDCYGLEAAEAYAERLASMSSAFEVAALEQHDIKEYEISGRLFGLDYACMLPKDLEADPEEMGNARSWFLLYHDDIEDGTEEVVKNSSSRYTEESLKILLDDAKSCYSTDEIISDSLWAEGYFSAEKFIISDSSIEESSFDVSDRFGGEPALERQPRLKNFLDLEDTAKLLEEFKDEKLLWEDQLPPDVSEPGYYYTLATAAHTDLHESDEPSYPPEVLKAVMAESYLRSLTENYKFIGDLTHSEAESNAAEFLHLVKGHDDHSLKGQLENLDRNARIKRDILNSRIDW